MQPLPSVAPVGEPPAATPVVRLQGRRGRRLRILLAILVAALLLGASVAVWWLQPQPLLPEAQAAMASTPAVTVSGDRGWVEFRPAAAATTSGLILYPGGKVEPAGYARSAQAIAREGHLVVIVPMPLNLAVLGADRAGDVIAAYPEIQTWTIGGHSLGGAMAGQFADQHPELIDGLALWAAWPNGDLSDQPELAAISIHGSLDASADRFDSAETMADLPEGTGFLVIEGGNHEQMGDYTGQPNDPPATIPRDEQQAIVQAATLELLERLRGGPAGS